MSSGPVIVPGTTPSVAAIRVAHVLSTGRGGNAGVVAHPQGHRAVAGSCGPQSGIDLYSLDPMGALQSRGLDVEFADIGVTPEPSLIPPASEGTPEDWPTHILPVLDVAMAANGDTFGVAAGKGVHLFELSPDDSELVPRGVLRGAQRGVGRVALTARGDRALATSGDGSVVLWLVAEGQEVLRMQVSRSPTTASFIWNDMLGLVGDESGRIVCWELQSGQRHLQFQGHHGAVHRAQFSAEKGILLTSGGDGAGRMWNLTAGKQVGTDLLHRGPVWGCTFAHGGRYAVTVSQDRHLGIWDASNGRLLDWYRDSEPLVSVAFRRLDGALVIGGPRSVKVLRVDWQKLVSESSRADINLSESGMGPARPLPTPAATGAVGMERAAPVGAIMPARQTGDLPIPDRSNLPMTRPGNALGRVALVSAAAAQPGGAAAKATAPQPAFSIPDMTPSDPNPFAAGAAPVSGAEPGKAKKASTAFFSGISDAVTSGAAASPAAPPSSGPAQGVPVPARGPTPSVGVPALPRGAPGAGPSRSPTPAAGVPAVPRGAAARGGGTGSHQVVRPAPPVASLGDLGSAAASVPHAAKKDEAMAIVASPARGIAGAAGQGASNSPAAHPTGDASETPSHVSRAIAELREQEEKRKKPRRPSASGDDARFLVIASLTVLLLALGASQGARWAWRTSIVPADLAEGYETEASRRDEVVATAQAELEDFVARQNEVLHRYEVQGTLVDSELQRVRDATARRIEDRRAETDAQVAAAEEAYVSATASLDARRGETAKAMGVRALAVTLVLGLVVSGVWFARRRRAR